MPTVPQYNQYNIPTVSPIDAPDIRSSVTAQAFGAGVGNAVAGIGKEIDQLGGVLSENAIKAKLLEIQADTDIATSAWSIDQSKLDEAYKLLEGKAALDGRDAYVKASQELREKYATSLRNPYARKQFDSDSRRFFSYSIRNSAAHAAQQGKKYTTDANVALMSTAIQNVTGAPTDPSLTADAEETAWKVARTEGISKGWTPEQVEAAASAGISQIWKTKMITLARTDPAGASKMLEENKQKLQPTDAIEVQAKIETGKQGRLSEGQMAIDSMTKLVESDIKSIEATGSGNSSLTRPMVKATLGAAAADKWQEAQNVGTQVYNESLRFTYMTPTQIQEQVKRWTPEAGSPSYAMQAARYQRIKEIGDQQIWLQATDPALSVGMDPNVKAAAPGSPELFAARIAAQKRAGIKEIPPSEGGIGQSPITVDEAKELLIPLDRMLPGQEHQTMGAIISDAKRKYGEEYWRGAVDFAFKSVSVQKDSAERIRRTLTKAQQGASAGVETPEGAVAPLMPPAAPVAPARPSGAPSGAPASSGNVMFGGSGDMPGTVMPLPPVTVTTPARPPAPRKKASERVLEGK